MTEPRNSFNLMPFVWTALGAIVLVAGLGLYTGTLVWGSTAQRMAEDAAKLAHRDLMTKICVARAQADSEGAPVLSALAKEGSYWERASMVEDAKWALEPGATRTDTAIARACADQLYKISRADPA